MAEKRDDKIEDVLVDSDLAKQLVPNKFKFTSHQGRIRRQKLLMGAKKLSETAHIDDITLADVCEEAGIPRASAYHFFPNVEAIFLALRFLNAIESLAALSQIKTDDYNRWQGYVTAIIDTGVSLLHEDKTKARLIYEANTPEFSDDSHGKKIEHQVAKLVYDNLASRYEMPDYDNIENVLLISYGIVNAVFTLSYRIHQEITEEYRQEAITACIAYLRCYLPEKLHHKLSS
ncbi:MAG: TetR family transcriptional regulator [Pseudomonadales bacterium]|nr:MAG: TetR family transcriptional regulator [Pseudomonadales bacterium]